MKYLTVFSDASHDHVTGAAGYAFFVRDEVTIIKRSFQVPFAMEKSVDVELFGMCHAIKQAIELLPSSPGDCIVAQTDCDHVIRCFTGQQRMDEFSQGICRGVFTATEEAGLSVRFKHVKAHTGAEDRRSWVNRWCDKAARREMQKKRRSLSWVIQ